MTSLMSSGCGGHIDDLDVELSRVQPKERELPGHGQASEELCSQEDNLRRQSELSLAAAGMEIDRSF